MQEDSAKSSGTIVVLGASYAGGWDVQRIAGRRVINCGVAGQQSFELAERFERDVVAARPDAVIIWGFINDLFRTLPEAVVEVQERVRHNYLRMVDSARRNGIEPILATEVTIRPADTWSETIASCVGSLMGKESYQDRVNRQARAVNQDLMALATRERLLLLDFRGALDDRDGRRRREFIQADGSHITAAGYEALTAYATPVLEEHFSAK